MRALITSRKPNGYVAMCVSCVAIVQLSCAPDSSHPEFRSDCATDGISLKAACAFHQKFARLISLQDKVGLFYRGDSLFMMRGGPMAQIDRHNVWETGYYIPVAALPDPAYRVSYTQGSFDFPDPAIFKYFRMFEFRIEPFGVTGSNRIPIRMGQYAFDIVVHKMYDVKTIDEMLPVFGMSIRQFVKRVEQPTPFDDGLGIVNQQVRGTQYRID